MCEKCPKCNKKDTMDSVSGNKKLTAKYGEDSDMMYGCVCSECGAECCQCC